MDPPCSPAPGPMSTTWSASKIVSAVVLHHYHRVAEVSQPDECVQELAVVALVKADRRFVQNVKNAYKTRADLTGKSDPLSLPTRQRGGPSCEREIVEPDVQEEFRACLYLAENPVGDQMLTFCQLDLVHGLCCPGYGQAAQLEDVARADCDRK